MKSILAAATLFLAAGPLASNGVALSHARLIERSGTQMNFSRDAVGDHIAVIGFTWGGCTTVCPITDRIMAQTQAKMGARLGEVRLVTITLDPLGDPPRALAKRAAELEAGRHWLWLGGDFRAVSQVLAGLGAQSRTLAEHPPLFIVADGRTKAFVRKQGLPSSDELVAMADRMIAARKGS